MDIINVLGVIIEVLSVLLQVCYHVIDGILRNVLPSFTAGKSVEGEVILITGYKTSVLTETSV